MGDMLRCNVPLGIVKKYLVMKTKANICRSNNPKRTAGDISGSQKEPS